MTNDKPYSAGSITWQRCVCLDYSRFYVFHRYIIDANAIKNNLRLQSWGGKENGFGLADCCREQPEKVRLPFDVKIVKHHLCD